MKIDINDIKYMVNECINLINEGWQSSYRRLPDGDLDYDGDELYGDEEENEDPEEIERKRRIDNFDFNAFVVIDDSDGAVIGTYSVGDDDASEAYDAAYEDAKAKAIQNKFGSYSVYGCIDDTYDDDTLIFNTNEK